MYDIYDNLTARLRASGEYLWPLVLRLIMFWEFWESGITKLNGENWFADIPWADWQKGFPWPFDLVPTDLSWLAATWGELVFAVMILLGLFTRFAAASLLVITVVATAAVHWPAEWGTLGELWKGYVITSEGRRQFQTAAAFRGHSFTPGFSGRRQDQSRPCFAQADRAGQLRHRPDRRRHRSGADVRDFGTHNRFPGTCLGHQFLCCCADTGAGSVTSALNG